MRMISRLDNCMDEDRGMSNTDIERKKLVACLADCGTNNPNLPYHNFDHAINVLQSLSIYVINECVSSKEKFLLKTAAILHDRIYIPGKSGENEVNTANYVRKFLPTIGYNREEIESVAKLIEATDLKKEPKTLLERIIRDADTDVLGTDMFYKTHCLLYQEIKTYLNPSLTRHEWYVETLQFLKTHKYYTDTAKRLRQPQKEENIKLLEGLVRGGMSYEA